MKKTTFKKRDLIKIERKPVKSILDKIEKPVVYRSTDYNLSSKFTGKNIKIAIIDSGSPKHKDIIVKEKISFCKNSKHTCDKLGHATMMAGIIKSNHKSNIKGIAPKTEIYCTKIVDDEENCSFNSLIAAILWAIVKKVNIILISLGTQYDYEVLHDSIKKAHKLGICIIAAAGNDKNKEINFPARYPEVFSVGNSSKNNADFKIPQKEFTTTYLNNKYIKTSGSSPASALVAGLTSLLIEKYPNHSTEEIYDELKKILK